MNIYKMRIEKFGWNPADWFVMAESACEAIIRTLALDVIVLGWEVV